MKGYDVIGDVHGCYDELCELLDKIGQSSERKLIFVGDLIDIFHKKNLKVNVWTVDDEKNLRKLEDMGVDYITTNVFQQKD